MFIALYLIVCANLADRATCMRIAVTDNTQVPEMTMTVCMGIQGEVMAQYYWDEHHDMHQQYKFGGWACELGNRKQPKEI